MPEDQNIELIVDSVLSAIREEFADHRSESSISDRVTHLEETLEHIKKNYISQDNIKTIIDSAIKAYMEETSAQRRAEIRQEMKSSVQEFFSWKRVTGFILVTFGIIEGLAKVIQIISSGGSV